MGTWGAGIYQNDYTLDLLSEEVDRVHEIRGNSEIAHYDTLASFNACCIKKQGRQRIPRFKLLGKRNGATTQASQSSRRIALVMPAPVAGVYALSEVHPG